jgi:hypothetical protein
MYQTNTVTTNTHGQQLYIRADILGNLTNNTASANQPTELYLYDSSVMGTVSDSGSMVGSWVLMQARGMTFVGAVTIRSYGTINNCAFLSTSSVHLTSTSLDLGNNRPNGMYETYFQSGCTITLTVNAPGPGVNYETLLFVPLGTTNAVILVDDDTDCDKTIS